MAENYELETINVEGKTVRLTDKQLTDRFNAEVTNRTNADKALQENINNYISNNHIINAINIGCDATGKNDCSTLIQNACSSNPDYLLYFPSGNYLINSPLTINNPILAIGNIKTTNNIVIFTLTSDIPTMHFNTIEGINADNTRTGTAIKVSSNHYQQGGFIRGKKINSYNGIIITATVTGTNKNYIQEMHIEIGTMYCKNSCITINKLGNTWNQQITVINTAIHEGGCLISDADHISFIGCSFEENNPAITANNSSLIITDSRLLYGENTKWFNLTKTNVCVNGLFSEPTNSLATLDTESCIAWNGLGYNAYSALNYQNMVTVYNGSKIVNYYTPLSNLPITILTAKDTTTSENTLEPITHVPRNPNYVYVNSSTDSNYIIVKWDPVLDIIPKSQNPFLLFIKTGTNGFRVNITWNGKNGIVTSNDHALVLNLKTEEMFTI